MLKDFLDPFDNPDDINAADPIRRVEFVIALCYCSDIKVDVPCYTTAAQIECVLPSAIAALMYDHLCAVVAEAEILHDYLPDEPRPDLDVTDPTTVLGLAEVLAAWNSVAEILARYGVGVGNSFHKKKDLLADLPFEAVAPLRLHVAKVHFACGLMAKAAYGASELEEEYDESESDEV